jgi:secondary thiamine-phosphate synthase enzyme
MDTTEFTVRTGAKPSIHDLTEHATRFVSGRGDGLLSAFVPHATAGLAIVEVGAGSDDDVLTALDALLPAEEGRWVHRHGSRGHGRDHVVPALVAPSLTVPVVDGVMTLGTWQSIVLVDTNGDNHERKVRLSFLRG